MRCLACGVEMQLVGVVADATAPIPGYAHHSFECPSCHDTETRLLFGRAPAKAAPPPVPEPMLASANTGSGPVPPAPMETGVAAPAEKAAAPLTGWGRALAKLRRRLDRGN